MYDLETKRKIELYEGWVELGKDTANLRFYSDFSSFLNRISEEDFINMGYLIKEGKIISKSEAIRRLNEILKSKTALTLIQLRFIHGAFYSSAGEREVRMSIPGVKFSPSNNSSGWGHIGIETLKKIWWLIAEYPFYCDFCGEKFIPCHSRNNLCSECRKDRGKIHGILRYNKRLGAEGKQRVYKSKVFNGIKTKRKVV